jgi:hypothetical protein
VRARQKPLHLRQLAPAPHEAAQLDWEVAAVDCFSSLAMPQPTLDDRATLRGRPGSTVPLMKRERTFHADRRDLSPSPGSGQGLPANRWYPSTPSPGRGAEAPGEPNHSSHRPPGR